MKIFLIYSIYLDFSCFSVLSSKLFFINSLNAPDKELKIASALQCHHYNVTLYDFILWYNLMFFLFKSNFPNFFYSFNKDKSNVEILYFTRHFPKLVQTLKSKYNFQVFFRTMLKINIINWTFKTNNCVLVKHIFW